MADPASPATPLQESLRTLDLGGNPLLAWNDPIEAVFACHPASGGGFPALEKL
jgi:hypothetical protein